MGDPIVFPPPGETSTPSNSSGGLFAVPTTQPLNTLAVSAWEPQPTGYHNPTSAAAISEDVIISNSPHAELSQGEKTAEPSHLGNRTFLNLVSRKRPIDDTDTPTDTQTATRREGLRSQNQEGWRELKASVIIQGNLYDPEPSAREAQRAEAHISTPNNIEVNIFCDGSFGSDANKKKGIGGYAIAFKKNRPGQHDDQEEVLMAWRMDPGIESSMAEALALAQALVQARQEVIATTKAFLTSSNGTVMDTGNSSPQDPLRCSRIGLGTKHIVVNIFSDSRQSLRPRPIRINHRSDDLKSKITRLSFDAVDELVNLQIPEMGFHPCVKVQLQWLPSHILNHEVRLHVLADRAAGEARSRGSFLQVGSGEPQAIHYGLYDAMKRHFVNSMVRGQGVGKSSKREREDDEGAVEHETKRLRPQRVIYDESEEMRPRFARYGTKRRFAEESSDPAGGETGSDIAMLLDERPMKEPKRIAATLVRSFEMEGLEPSNLESSARPNQRIMDPAVNLTVEHLSLYEHVLGSAGPNNLKLDPEENLPYFFDLERSTHATVAKSLENSAHVNNMTLDEWAPTPSNANLDLGTTQPFSFGLGYTVGLTLPPGGGQNAKRPRKPRQRNICRNSTGGIAPVPREPRTRDASTQTPFEGFPPNNTTQWGRQPSILCQDDMLGQPVVFRAGTTAAWAGNPASTPANRVPDGAGLDHKPKSKRRRGTRLREQQTMPRIGEKIMSIHAPDAFSHFMMSSYH
ncbi:hypothetical protein QBC39DRAFT_112568 [Podospora conica]|nr:hypothetical protein QBC39DRAFT_112568 [Schizothecium conicum]